MIRKVVKKWSKTVILSIFGGVQILTCFWGQNRTYQTLKKVAFLLEKRVPHFSSLFGVEIWCFFDVFSCFFMFLGFTVSNVLRIRSIPEIHSITTSGVFHVFRVSLTPRGPIYPTLLALHPVRLCQICESYVHFGVIFVNFIDFGSNFDDFGVNLFNFFQILTVWRVWGVRSVG